MEEQKEIINQEGEEKHVEEDDDNWGFPVTP